MTTSRFYDPEFGQVVIGGQNIKTVSQTSLRSSIGVVPQVTCLGILIMTTYLCSGHRSLQREHPVQHQLWQDRRQPGRCPRGGGPSWHPQEGLSSDPIGQFLRLCNPGIVITRRLWHKSGRAWSETERRRKAKGGNRQDFSQVGCSAVF